MEQSQMMLFASGRQQVVLFMFALILVTSSCRITDHSDKDPNEVTPDALEIPASGFDPGNGADKAIFTFDSTARHMGRISQGEQVEKIYGFVNTGKRDLLITDVRGSCGCTVGKEWPKTPVHPGQSGSITVHFDSEGRSGMQNKTITVVANTDPPTTVLTLSGEVVAPPGSAPAE